MKHNTPTPSRDHEGAGVPGRDAQRPASRRPTAAFLLLAALLTPAAFTSGCIRHQVDPLHITVDVNLRVDRQLDDFFEFEEELEPELEDDDVREVQP